MEPPRARSPDTLVVLAFAAIVLLLGVNFVAVRFSNRELAPFWGAGVRFLVAAVLLFAIAALRRPPLPRGRALVGAVLFGVLSFGVTYALIYWGLVRVSAGTASIVFALNPLLTLLIAALVGLERLRARTIVGALLALGGIALAFVDQLALDVPLVSLFAILASTTAAAASGVVIKRFPRADPVGTNAVAMATGAALLLAASALARETPTLPTAPSTMAALAWLVFSSSTAFVLMVWVLARWSASAVSYVAVLTPVVAIGAGAVLAREAVTLLVIAGALVTLAGAWLGVREPAKPAAPTVASARTARR